MKRTFNLERKKTMMSANALGNLFDTADTALQVLHVALEGEDVSKIVEAGDMLADLRRELAAVGVVVESDE